VTSSPYAHLVTPELERLLEVLEDQRGAVLRKLAGLSDEDARRSTVPSGTNLAGLVQHLTFVESKWFEGIVAGGSPRKGPRSMVVAPDVSLRDLRSEYRAACEASNQVIASIGTAEAPVGHDGGLRDLRWAMLAVIQETARHVGHADIIREQIDGQTGR